MLDINQNVKGRVQDINQDVKGKVQDKSRCERESVGWILPTCSFASKCTSLQTRHGAEQYAYVVPP